MFPPDAVMAVFYRELHHLQHPIHHAGNNLLNHLCFHLFIIFSMEQLGLESRFS